MFERWKRYWKRDADLELEIRGHLETEIDERVDAGESATEARYAAQRAFGNRMLAAEETRAVWGWPAVEALGQDVRYGVRLLGRSRAFALFAVASLALGIGATTAIFTLFDAIVLKHLPVKEPDRLVTLSFAMEPGRSNSYLPYPQFARMREGNRTLDGLFAAAGPDRIAVAVNGQAGAGVPVVRHWRLLYGSGIAAGAWPLTHKRRRPSGQCRCCDQLLVLANPCRWKRYRDWLRHSD